MPTTPPDPPPSTLRRRLAAQRPGRPTAIACAIATALAAVGLDGPRPDNATAAGDRPGAAQLATESPSAMALAHSGILAYTTVSLRRAVVGPRPHPGELNRPTLDRRDGRSPFRPGDGGAESARSEADRGSGTRAIDAAKAQLGGREHLVRRPLRPFQPERSREAPGASQRPRPALRAIRHRDRAVRRQIPQGVQPPPPGSRPRPFCDRGHSPAQQNPNSPRRPKDAH
jgi:hypothetical protein